MLMRGCGAASPASAPSRSWFKVFGFGFLFLFFFARAARATNAHEGSRVSFGSMCGNFTVQDTGGGCAFHPQL